MNTLDDFIALDPASYTHIITLEAGRLFWVPPVERYLIELQGSIGQEVSGDEVEEVPIREIWTNSLIVVMEYLGGVEAVPLATDAPDLVGPHGQLALQF